MNQRRNNRNDKNRNRERRKSEKETNLEAWMPKTEAGRLVQNEEVTSYTDLVKLNLPIIEPEIVDKLLPDLQEKMVEFRKTTRVRRSGRQFSFRAAVLVGDKHSGYVGIGVAKDKEKWPAVRKATKSAKLNLIKIRRGSGSWEETSQGKHSIPFTVEGKCASVKVKFMSAPKGTGLVVGDNVKDVFRFVGVEDVWSKSRGSTGTKLNFVRATIDALSKTSSMKVSAELEAKFSK